MNRLSVAELAEKLARKEVSALELTDFFLGRSEALNPRLNAFITLDGDGARRAARASDERRARSEALGPLDGVPMAHKDIFCTRGLRTTCASKMLANFVPSYDAFVVEQLNKAGAVCLGKVSMDEFAMGSSNEHSAFGPVRNPHDLERIPGGSSGGSASAVAGGLVAYATGSDTGGSIRQPAAYCGLTGIKPSYGTLSRYGMIAYASSLDQAGALAPTAEDCALILNGMAGYDRRDSTANPQALTRFEGQLGEALRGVKIGLPRGYFNGLNEEMQALIRAAADTYQALGAEIREVDLNTDSAIAAYYLIASAEASSNLARFDGVRYGYRAEGVRELQELYVRSRSEGFGEEVKRRIMIGTYALSSGYYEAYYEQARRARRAILNEFNRVFGEVDVLLTPTTPTPAYALGSKLTNPVEMFLGDLYTVAVNLAGLPALSHPCGFSGPLPVGAQLIGPHHSEPRLLNLAHQYQRQTDFHRRRPTL